MTVVTLRPARPPWWNQLDLNQKGSPLTHYRNAYVAISGDALFSGGFAYDDMLHMTVLTHDVGQPMESVGFPRPVSDNDVRNVQRLMHELGLNGMGFDNVYAAINEFGSKRRFNPAHDYLEGLEWDGENRASWLSTYLGVPPTPYTDRIGTLFLISMVARIYEPGCKVDYMLVLEGPQGELKSAALRTLGDPWFSDNLPDISMSGKDASTHLRGKWLIEIAEMHAFNKAESTQLKSFITRQEERFRPPYGRNEVIEPRMCVFAGTTNKDLYLKDETGGRRFWPVRCGLINIALLERDRDQLFAEAVQLYKEGINWWPDRAFEKKYITPEQEGRYDGDLWEDLIRDYVNARTPPLTLKQIAVGCLGYENPGAGFSGETKMPLTRFGTYDQNRAKRALAAIGWGRVGRQGGTGATLFGPLR
jgi:predicted P-loop ATPase